MVSVDVRTDLNENDAAGAASETFARWLHHRYDSAQLQSAGSAYRFAVRYLVPAGDDVSQSYVESQLDDAVDTRACLLNVARRLNTVRHGAVRCGAARGAARHAAALYRRLRRGL